MMMLHTSAEWAFARADFTRLRPPPLAAHEANKLLSAVHVSGQLPEGDYCRVPLGIAVVWIVPKVGAPFGITKL